MSEGNEFHLHLHEGVTPDVARAAIREYKATRSLEPPPDVDEAGPSNPAAALAKRAYNDSDGRMGPLLEFLADNPDRLVPFTEASSALGFPSARSMPGLLGAFGRRANHRYGGKWPFEKIWHEGAWHMRMDGDVAELIRELRDHEQ